MEQSRQSEIIKSALENVKSIIDANTVTGTPINTEGGTVIIPISKVFVGMTSGGVDYFGKRNSSVKNFGGGGGTGVTVSPVGFLVVSRNGKVDFISVEGSRDPFARLVDLVEGTPEIFEKIKRLFENKEEASSIDK